MSRGQKARNSYEPIEPEIAALERSRSRAVTSLSRDEQ